MIVFTPKTHHMTSKIIYKPNLIVGLIVGAACGIGVPELLLQDADEMLDFSNPKRRDLLLNEFKSSRGSIQFFNTRFWWDFDNFSNYDKYIPCHQVGKLRERGFQHRNRECKTINLPEICGFEYSHCFPKNGNWKKVNSASHD